jgi:hypothetical protein
MTIRLDLVNEYGPLLAAVPGQIALPVSCQIQPADPTAVMHRLLPYPGANRAPLPVNVTGHSDIHR